MSNTTSTHAGAIAPVTLHLEPAALMAALSAILPSGKVGYTSGEHIELINRLLPHLKNDTGEAAAIDSKLGTVINAVFRPTEAVLRSLLRLGFAEAGYVLDADTERMFVMMFSAPQFADFLAKTDNPKTGKPFIQKEARRGAKKKTFTALIATGMASPTGNDQHGAAAQETPVDGQPEAAAQTVEPTSAPEPKTTTATPKPATA